MLNRLYQIIGGIAGISLVLVLINRDKILTEALMWITSILFLVLVAAVHGMLAHSLKPKQKSSLIFYPVLMGILYGLMAAVYFFLLMPFITS
jgi:hypothetical protein